MRNWQPLLRYLAIAGFGVHVVSAEWSVPGSRPALEVLYVAIAAALGIAVLAIGARRGAAVVRARLGLLVPLGCALLAEHLVAELLLSNVSVPFWVGRPLATFSVLGVVLALLNAFVGITYAIWQTILLVDVVRARPCDPSAALARVWPVWWRGAMTLAVPFVLTVLVLALCLPFPVALVVFGLFGVILAFASVAALALVVAREGAPLSIAAAFAASWRSKGAWPFLLLGWFFALGAVTWVVHRGGMHWSVNIPSAIAFPVETEWYSDVCGVLGVQPLAYWELGLYALFVLVAFAVKFEIFARLERAGMLSASAAPLEA